VYPVASLLDAAGMTDDEARAAIDDRMIGQLLTGLVTGLRRMKKRGQLAPGVEPERAAQAIWEASHLRAWRSLVIECGWSLDEFKRSRMDLARSFLKRRMTVRD
jgi:hypothetical protein